MNRKPLWKISLTASGEAEEALMELFAQVLGAPATAYIDFETGKVTVTAFFQHRADFSLGKRAALEAGLKLIRAAGVSLGRAAPVVRKVPVEDWAESWKRHFKPITIGSVLLLKPSWSRRRAKRGQAMVVLDPGLSFGTGQHPTTGFCLRQLAAGAKSRGARSLLDVGSGSGILALAAAKLGYAPVCGLDNDAEAVRIARANAQKNRVARAVTFLQQDVTKLPRQVETKYAFVCANLTTDLLLKAQPRLLDRLALGGRLIIAGILKQEFPRVRAACAAAGLRLAASRTEKEWRSGAFEWRRPR